MDEARLSLQHRRINARRVDLLTEGSIGHAPGDLFRGLPVAHQQQFTGIARQQGLEVTRFLPHRPQDGDGFGGLSGATQLGGPAHRRFDQPLLVFRGRHKAAQGFGQVARFLKGATRQRLSRLLA